jgi:hypothetical protein
MMNNGNHVTRPKQVRSKHITYPISYYYYQPYLCIIDRVVAAVVVVVVAFSNLPKCLLIDQ